MQQLHSTLHNYRSSVAIVTIPQGGQPNNRGSISGAVREFSLLKNDQTGYEGQTASCPHVCRK